MIKIEFLQDDKFYNELSDEYKEVVRQNIIKGKCSATFLDVDLKIWHGAIQECPSCKTSRITSCCACGCGSCYTCGYRFCCIPTPQFLKLENNVFMNEKLKAAANKLQDKFPNYSVGFKSGNKYNNGIDEITLYIHVSKSVSRRVDEQLKEFEIDGFPVKVKYIRKIDPSG